MSESSFATVGDLVSALVERRISSLELVDAAIARIEDLDADINAVVVRDFERARTAARAADGALARGAGGALLGVPMTVKEAINVAGLPTTWGMPPFRDWMAPADAVAVTRLKAAGAIVLGKTNVPPFLADWQCANPLHGRTVNPWDPARTPGGSSGGAAAALASGLVPLELGSDLAGSIRIPAAFCGVFGHKPSFGLVPMGGAAPPGVEGLPPPLAVLGPMARCAADLALALEVLAGPAGEEAKGYRLALPAARHESLSTFRVLVLDELPGVPLDGAIRQALRTLADRLAGAGARVEAADPALLDPGAMLDCFRSLIEVVTTRGAPSGSSVSAHEWMEVQDAQLTLQRRWASLFETFDVVIAPAFGTVAFEHDESSEMNERTLLIDGEQTPYAAQGAWSAMASVGNLPATAVPLGTSAAGLPVGVQVIGPYLEDRTTIAFARLLEQEFGGFQPPSGF